MAREPTPITGLLERVANGDLSARTELWRRVEGEVRSMAEGRLQREQSDRPRTTTVVHETFLRLFGGARPQFQNRAHFYGAVARVMQQILVDEARRRRLRPRPVDPEQLMEALAESSPASWDAESLDALDRELGRMADDPRHRRKSEAVRLHYLAGMSARELAEVFGVSVDTVKRDLRLARAWLHHSLKQRRRPDGRSRQ